MKIDCDCFVCQAYLLGREHGVGDEKQARLEEMRGPGGSGTPGYCSLCRSRWCRGHITPLGILEYCDFCGGPCRGHEKQG